MSSTRALEATLPLYPPEGSDGRRDPDHFEFAVYSLIRQNDAGRESLLDDLNNGDMASDQCCLAPKPDFAGRTLKDIYEYHIEEAKKDDNTMNPYFFIVADQEDWEERGVLVVYLLADRDLFRDDDHDGENEEDRYEHVVGVGRCSVDDADCAGVNLDISKLSWSDFKDSWYRDGWDDDNPDTNPRYSKYSWKTGEEN